MFYVVFQIQGKKRVVACVCSVHAPLPFGCCVSLCEPESSSLPLSLYISTSKLPNASECKQSLRLLVTASDRLCAGSTGTLGRAHRSRAMEKTSTPSVRKSVSRQQNRIRTARAITWLPSIDKVRNQKDYQPKDRQV